MDCSALSGYPDPKISGVLCAQVRAHMPCQNPCSVDLILKFKMNLKNKAHPKIRSEFKTRANTDAVIPRMFLSQTNP